MKITKNKTAVALFLALIISFAVGVFTVNRSFADETPASISATDYFTITDKDGGTASTAKIEGGNLVLPLKSGDTAKSVQDLYLSDFAVKVNVPNGVTVDFIVYYTAKMQNGVKNDKDEYETAMEHTILSSVTGEQELAVTYDNFEVEPDVYCGNFAGKIGFKRTDNGTEAADIKIEYIDQKASDTDAEKPFRQTFALNEGNNDVAKAARPVALFTKSFYSTLDGGAVNKVAFQDISLSFATYSVKKLSSTPSFRVEAAEGDEDKVWISTDGKKVNFKADASLKIVSGEDEDKIVYNTVAVKAGKDETAPVYTADAAAKEAFEAKLESSLFKETDGVKHYIRLGDSNYLDLPTLADLVSDVYTAYSDMTYTVWYRSQNSDWSSTSSYRVPVRYEGVYQFYVLFTDKSGNGMKKDDFVDDKGAVKEGMKDYVFTFEVYNDAPVEVTAATSQEDAYKGVSFTASSFTFLALDYTEKYELYYSATENGDYSEKIYSSAELAELGTDSAEYKKYNAYAYDGKLTFTPQKTGFYKITVTAYENGTTRSDSAETIIRAASAPKRVVPNADNWALNNVWSIVFLATGTLSLIGIIVVLCIKPKDEPETQTKKKK